MNIKIIENPKVICSNHDSPNRYFGWPSICRLPDGKLMMGASGFRYGHICPFGKVIACYSNDEGQNWSMPTVIMDTPLDDRDCGLCVGKDNTVMMTSFNNTAEDQKRFKKASHLSERKKAIFQAYIDYLESTDAEEKYLGSVAKFSFDGGYHFTNFTKLPISNPHGPLALENGKFLYIGTKSGFFDAKEFADKEDTIFCYIIDKNGDFEYLSSVPDVKEADGEINEICEPYAILLPNGKIIVHIRVHIDNNMTLYQSESLDGGKTFSTPHRILETNQSAPSHLLLHSSGVLIATYSYRDKPYGIRAMLSYDNGETWETEKILSAENIAWGDLGYPCSVELKDGNILTVYYEFEKDSIPKTSWEKDNNTYCAVIKQVVWKIEE